MAIGPFVRRYTSMPSITEILKIEGIVIVDLPQPPVVSGIPTGRVAFVGESLEGPDGVPVLITSDAQYRGTFGGYGFYSNPGGAHASLTPAHHDGNLHLATHGGATFGELVLVRVNDKCGTAALTVTAAPGTLIPASSTRTLPAGLRIATTGASPTDVFATRDAWVLADTDFAISSTLAKLSAWTLTAPGGRITWYGKTVVNAGSVTVTLYSDSARTLSVAEGVALVGAVVTLAATNASGLSGTVTSAADVASDATWTVSKTATIATAGVRRVLGTGATPSLTQFLAPDASCLDGFTLAVGASLTGYAAVDIKAAYQAATLTIKAQQDPVATVKKIVWARHFAGTDANAANRYAMTVAVDKSNMGNGAMMLLSPPLGTDQALANGATNEGVGNVAVERVGYCYPGIYQDCPEILLAADGAGYTSSLIPWPSDKMMACITSQLNPEEDPGQQTALVGWVLGIEDVPPTTGAAALPLTMEDYINGRTHGICMPKREGASYVFQSTGTAAGPTTEIYQRQFKDFAQESIGNMLGPNVKHLGTDALMDELLGAMTGFGESLKSTKFPEAARIRDYSVTEITDAGYTSVGIYPIGMAIEMFASAKNFLLITQIGPGVQVTVS